MDDRRILSTRFNPNDVARTSFSTVRKGFDPQEVRAHLEMLARELAQLESRLRDTQDQLNEALHRAANPVIDEATLAAALGAQSAAILRSAHDEAGRVTAEAQERTAQLFSETQQRAAAHLIEAQERVNRMLTDAERAAELTDAEARQAADRLIETAKVNGQTLVERGREQGRAIVEQASEARRTILSDLAVKRKALHLQIDQLRAARDSLVTSMNGLREKVEHTLDSLISSDEQARQAAIDALRLRAPVRDLTEDELLAGTPLRPVEAAPPGGPTPAVASAQSTPVTSTPPPTPVTSTALPNGEADSFVEEDPSGTDVVNEIFARLRKATLEERGASETAPKRPMNPTRPETPVGELFARRDQALNESLVVLVRKVKRALQDDQNITLDLVRDVSGDPSDRLEDEMSQRARYSAAALDALVDAAAAGVQFAVDEAGAGSVEITGADVEECVTDLAVTVVVALRRRIAADGHDQASERVNAAYREWRGARIERLATDAGRRAFHLGVILASRGRVLRFLNAPDGPPCDACTLDAATQREAGQSFPSGAIYPPVHAGCACTVIPA
jgi:DivIVA domain-containing protein